MYTISLKSIYNAEVIKLNLNYRSTQNIVGVVMR